jgi:hypothetical protein
MAKDKRASVGRAYRFTQETVENLERAAARRTGGNVTQLIARAAELLANPPADPWACGVLGLTGEEIDSRVRQSLEAWALAVDLAAEEIKDSLAPEGWRAVAEANPPALWVGPTSRPGLHLSNNVEDAVRRGDLAKSVVTRELLENLWGLSLTEAWAMAYVVRWYYDHTGLFDPVKDPWWEPSFRRKVSARAHETP